MHVELKQVDGPLDTEGRVIYVNPRHVALIEPELRADEEGQSFITNIIIVDVGLRKVAGTPSEIRKALNGGTRS